LPQLSADGQGNDFSQESNMPHDGDRRQVAASHILHGGDGADSIEGLAGEKSAFNASVQKSERGNGAGLMGLFEA
jgi:hypothetical protein